jgi:hypothetical protein
MDVGEPHKVADILFRLEIVELDIPEPAASASSRARLVPSPEITRARSARCSSLRAASITISRPCLLAILPE